MQQRSLGKGTGIRIRRNKRDRALARQCSGKNVGRRMQITLVVSADQLSIFRKGDVTLENAGAHARARFMAFLGVLGKLQGSAPTVANRKVSLFERIVTALLQRILEGAGTQFIDKIERARPELYVLAVFVRAQSSPRSASSP